MKPERRGRRMVQMTEKKPNMASASKKSLNALDGKGIEMKAGCRKPVKVARREERRNQTSGQPAERMSDGSSGNSVQL
jgi:hypothetical protein